MGRKYSLLITLCIGILLIGGITTYYLYAGDGCCGGNDKKCGNGGGCGGSAKNNSNDGLTLDQTIVKADKMLADLAASKKDETLKCQDRKEMMMLAFQMIQGAQTVLNQSVELMAQDANPDMTKVASATKQSNTLLKKALELISQGCPMMNGNKCGCGGADKTAGGCGCGAQGNNKTQGKDSTQTGQYVCPMGCVAPTDKPGKCPKCGMNLVKQK
jgi:hypothetical protein